jgi:hypothetical protein
VSHNGHRDTAPRIEVATSGASADEIAAITAAIELFLAESAPPAASAAPQGEWRRAALLEGVGLDPREPHRWCSP